LLEGYRGRILRVDLSARSFSEEPVAEADLVAFLGGRGLAALYYHREIGPQVDALAPDNKLIFMTGPLTGSALPATTKFELSTKSPETRMYLCSNCGGAFGTRLKQAGWDGLIVEGRAEALCWLSIEPGGVRFHDGCALAGLATDATLAALREAFGRPDAAGMAIGPAGERLVRISCINVDERAFGRGGPGAVMGSKLLKGIVVGGDAGPIPTAHPERVAAIRTAAVQELASTLATHSRFGTSQYVETINELGCMPTRNFQTSSFPGVDRIDAFAMRTEAAVTSIACPHCTVACGKVCLVTEGEFAGARARLEFETIAGSRI
jgi:aldehyde:ferredoxin oxidoreductase